MEGEWLELDYSAPIWMLMHVCYLWRDVALSNGVLWANIDASLGGTWTPAQSLQKARLQMLELYLERSRVALLDLRIGLAYHDAYPRILPTLWAHRQRWWKI
ncbi:hypothetical protein BD626DRAFT_490276 [Schizophyllum amplum]|uniref:F-box domain-containing protein n=1 Tax=Schizophyllum amplum TaxID=97359 RepID=A0A550CJD4_9AGAR|nr:hypothetical protein BD626DRAFT_490276 [Auriculariopsis ampla]